MDKPKPVRVAVIEEGQGVSEEVWKAVERMCADPGSKGKIFSVFAPTDALYSLREAEENRLDEEEDLRDMKDSAAHWFRQRAAPTTAIDLLTAQAEIAYIARHGDCDLIQGWAMFSMWWVRQSRDRGRERDAEASREVWPVSSGCC